jgi:hypothetical protein
MTEGALLTINVSSSHERSLIGLNWDGRRQFAIDARMQWNAGDEAFKGQRRVSHSNWRMTIGKP